MSFGPWLDLIKKAEKTSIISGNVRKVHYTFPDGRQMVEEYSLETGVVLRRAWKKQKNLMGEPQWELELGDANQSLPNEDNNCQVREGNEEPVLSKRITKRNIEWRIRNLPYPLETYIVTTDQEKKSIVVRTTNKKYFKVIQVPELDRCGLVPEMAYIKIHHQYNTLIITYEKPKLLCDLEVETLKELKNVETETDMDDLIQGLLTQ